MAALGYAYVPTDHDPDTRPDPFAAGRVTFMILNTDVKRTKTGNGSFLWLELEVQGGPNAGRKWWDQITLDNPNPQAVEIGQRQLSALCHSVGYLQPLTDSDVLHGKSGEAEVGIEPAGIDKSGKSFSAKNVTKKYIVPGAAGGATASRPAPANGNATQAAPAAAPKKKPWQ